MTLRYVGSGGSDANNGTSWATRKLTLTGVEATPVAAGDTVYVAPGTYRETLTCGVSGSAGNPIMYIGDYSGANTDGVGGVVRITGSDNDQTATRANCITATSKNYRTFQGFALDITTGPLITLITSCGNWIIDKCIFMGSAQQAISLAGTGTTNTIQNCHFFGSGPSATILFTHTSTVDNAAHLVQNCTLISGTQGIRFVRVGGATVKNCVFMGLGNQGGIVIGTALSIGQTETINNCIFCSNSVALSATATGEITENYNTFYANTTDRTNTNTGANSVAYPPLFDTRWLFQLVA